VYFIDTSAAVKLVSDEPESAAMAAWVRGLDQGLASSALLITELLRAARRTNPSRLSDAQRLLDDMLLVELRRAVLDRAAELEPAALRSLDAIHLAAALELGDELEGIVTYDRRLAEAAEIQGIDVVAPR